MRWVLSWRADPVAARLADRHYSRQTHGSGQFVPPGRSVVLVGDGLVAAWALIIHQEYVDHAWPGAWNCTLFRYERVEGGPLASDLVREALAACRWRLGDPPPEGVITMIGDGVRHKRDPGRCFRRAGFDVAGETKSGRLVLHMPPERVPVAEMPIGGTCDLWPAVVAA